MLILIKHCKIFYKHEHVLKLLWVQSIKHDHQIKCSTFRGDSLVVIKYIEICLNLRSFIWEHYFPGSSYRRAAAPHDKTNLRMIIRRVFLSPPIMLDDLERHLVDKSKKCHYELMGRISTWNIKHQRGGDVTDSWSDIPSGGCNWYRKSFLFR